MAAVGKTGTRGGRAATHDPASHGLRSQTGGPRLAVSDARPSEATLAQLWAGQRFPASALVTRQGVPLRALYPGRPGRGAGPDFRDAIIATPSGGLLRGDVELHVRASDFRSHGHDSDPRYDSVVLHLVFEDDAAADTRLASGRRVPVVALAPWARRRAEELRGWLAGPRLWREPCHDAIARLGSERVRAALAALGDRRFAQRETALALESGRLGPGEALYRALLAGLGYGGDSAALPALTEALPCRELVRRLAAAPEAERPALAEALLLGAAGLLSHQHGPGADDRHDEEAEALWRGSGLASLPPSNSPPAGTRPANHPARRLAGLARLLVRHGATPDGLGAELNGPIARLIAAWTAPAEGYWRTHLAPGIPSRHVPGALIGRGRALELLVNAVLPWLAATAQAEGDTERAARARACFARLPRPGRYGALAFLETNLRAEGRPLRLDARRQQGLLALYKTECTQGGCGRCPLS